MVEANTSSVLNEINWLVLQEAFNEFSKASTTLETSYKELQLEARRLSVELATANVELQRTVAEKESVENYLKNILQSLSDGVLVIDPARFVRVSNAAAARLLRIAPGMDSSPQSLDDLPIAPQLRDCLGSALSATQPLDDLEICLDFGPGARCHVIVSSSRLAGPAECGSGTAFILKDVTRLKELEVKTQRDQRLQAMGEIAIELAHEIRNPLGAIELFASLLSAELDENTQSSEWADQIVTGVKFMNSIVTNMLTFTRSSGPEFRAVDILQLMEDTLRFLDPVFEQRNIQVQGPGRQDQAVVYGDPEMLRQMLMNLLVNALRAMPERGRLSVQLKTYQGVVEIKVEDTGIGISDENLGRIFDPFFTTSEKGTGLGLALVHQIVEKHHGTVNASSEFGKGSCFTVSLPLQPKDLLTC